MVIDILKQKKNQFQNEAMNLIMPQHQFKYKCFF